MVGRAKTDKAKFERLYGSAASYWPVVWFIAGAGFTCLVFLFLALLEMFLASG